jgi:hypothetical protein
MRAVHVARIGWGSALLLRPEAVLGHTAAGSRRWRTTARSDRSHVRGHDCHKWCRTPSLNRSPVDELGTETSSECPAMQVASSRRDEGAAAYTRGVSGSSPNRTRPAVLHCPKPAKRRGSSAVSVAWRHQRCLGVAFGFLILSTPWRSVVERRRHRIRDARAPVTVGNPTCTQDVCPHGQGTQPARNSRCVNRGRAPSARVVLRWLSGCADADDRNCGRIRPERPDERLVGIVEDPAIGRDHQVTVSVPHHPDDRPVEVAAAG